MILSVFPAIYCIFIYFCVYDYCRCCKTSPVAAHYLGNVENNGSFSRVPVDTQC